MDAHPGSAMRPIIARNAALFTAALWLAFPPLARGGEAPGTSTFGEGGTFIRGDADQNAKLDITDAVTTLSYLFLGGEEPYCLDALDADDDGDLNLTDAIEVLSFLFLGEGDIPAPYPDAGLDPSADALGCDNGAFAHIRREIFAPSCATAGCHSSADGKGNLVLEGMRAYSSLVGVMPDNASARAAGLALVRPGKPADSFLYRKLVGSLGPNDGDLMPEPGAQLSFEKLELIRGWIAAGAVPSTPADIRLPAPARGEQINIPVFGVPAGREVQRNYYFKLKSEDELWVDRIEFVCPPGISHLNFFDGSPSVYPDGYFEDRFATVPFNFYNLKASSHSGRLDWRLPAGTAVRFKPKDQVVAQLHFVNTGALSSPVGGCAAINLHALEPGAAPVPVGTLVIKNKNIVIPRFAGEISFDYGITVDFYGQEETVKVAAVTGHFHWRGKRFEIRKWDGANKNLNGTPAPGEFDRMGPENTIFLSDDGENPPFNFFNEDDAPEILPGWGIVYRATYQNDGDSRFCFGTSVATQEHANAFLYFYPALPDQEFLFFPPDCTGQGCAVPCSG